MAVWFVCALLYAGSGTMSRTSLRNRMWAYCAASFGFTLLSSTFSFYYVKVFLNLYHIDEKWFHLAQILYLVWNAVNDPLFAYCQDTSASWMPTTRRELILYTGPLFGVAYLSAWFPWADSSWVTGLHLIVALCLYDTMFTFIGLALCCLFTEIAVTESERIRLTQMSQIVGFISSFSVTLCEFSSNSLKDFSKFQATTVLLAVLSAVFMVYAGKHAHTYYDVRKMAATNEEEKEEGCTQSTDRTSYWRLTWQILSDRNFLSFVITNFLQDFHRTFIMSFTVIICDQLISEDDVHPYVRSVFYGSISAIHSLIVIFGAPLVDKLGYFSVIRGNFVWKILSGLTMLFLGQGHPWLLILFLLADRAGACRLGQVVPRPGLVDTQHVKVVPPGWAGRHQHVKVVVLGLVDTGMLRLFLGLVPRAGDMGIVPRAGLVDTGMLRLFPGLVDTGMFRAGCFPGLVDTGMLRLFSRAGRHCLVYPVETSLIEHWLQCFPHSAFSSALAQSSVLTSNVSASLDEAFGNLRKVKDGFAAPRFNLASAHVHGFSTLIVSPPVDDDITLLGTKQKAYSPFLVEDRSTISCLFVSPIPDPLAWNHDALAIPWDDLNTYAFPPVALLPRIPVKLRATQRMALLLVAPYWPARSLPQDQSLKFRPPAWDLSVVLAHLTSADYEPLEEKDFEHVSFKTFFLLAFATAARISELHALDVSRCVCFRHPMTSMIFGTNALVVKPAQSLCPMFIVTVLNMYGYQHLKNGTLTSPDTSQLKEVMFHLACCLPVVMGCLQLLSWSFFSIRLRHAPSHTVDVTA
ncbi:uncharacterized protein LOC124281438 [Haliotis rubra]|uniref:uncharacterized protein LOC124281438 n=1 Tax=Haliotis rubra TaxID=36100 RepID=UPI001EE4EDBC|nr:uncharacterized protein LOC124281438 [Haliotis rubra]